MCEAVFALLEVPLPGTLDEALPEEQGRHADDSHRSPKKRPRCTEPASSFSDGPLWALPLRHFFEKVTKARGPQQKAIKLQSLCSGMCTEEHAVQDDPLPAAITSQNPKTCCCFRSHDLVPLAFSGPHQRHAPPKTKALSPELSQHPATWKAWSMFGVAARSGVLLCSPAIQEVGLLKMHIDFTAEVKPIAETFMAANCSAEHRFGSVEQITQALVTGSTLPCKRHNQHCSVPSDCPDIVVAGFPCAPYSTQRPQRHRQGRCSEGSHHPSYETQRSCPTRKARQ